MKKTIFLASSGLLLLSLSAISQNSTATGFLPQEPRAMAMGGAGVALGNSRQAHYYNPSLLINAPEDEDFSFEIDAAVRLSDSDKLLQSAADFESDNPISKLATSIDALGSTLDPVTEVNNVILDARALQNSIRSVTNKSFTLDANLGTFVSVPSNGIGWAVYVNAWTNMGIQGNLSPSDDITMTNFINTSQNALNGGIVTPDEINALINTNPTDALASSLSFQGAAIVETGLSLAKKQTINNYELDIGITPKIQQVTTFGSESTLKELQSEFEPFSANNTKATTIFNIDIGISKELDENWTTGLVIKNLIPYSFDVAAVNKDVKISPAMRIGAAWRNNWISAGADFDLTSNDDIATLTKTQFLALGAEFDVFILKLRGGYRHNFAGDGGSGPSIGLGLYLLGLNIDAAIASNDVNPSDITDVDNINFSAQLGLNW